MPDTFKAFVVDKRDDRYDASIRDLTLTDLPDEAVLVDVAYSCLNYKDGLAVTGKLGIVRSFPMVCGIDLAGTVVESTDPAFARGDRVLVNGWGLSESHWGGYSQKQRVKARFLTRVPAAFSLEDTMAIGTAGYTAMLCVMALEEAGVAPAAGDIVITGAAGGVGSIAVVLLAKLGYASLPPPAAQRRVITSRTLVPQRSSAATNSTATPSPWNECVGLAVSTRWAQRSSVLC